MSAYRAGFCRRCLSAFDEYAAREPMPAEYDPERCACMALLSFRYEVEPGVYVRRRIR